MVSETFDPAGNKKNLKKVGKNIGVDQKNIVEKKILVDRRGHDSKIFASRKMTPAVHQMDVTKRNFSISD